MKSLVKRGAVWLLRNRETAFKATPVPMVRCRNCKKRFRVLSRELLPKKTFTLPVIEKGCGEYLKPGGPALRPVVNEMGEYRPAHSTLHRWLGGLGERGLDRSKRMMKGVIHGAPTTAAVAQESAKRLGQNVRRVWNKRFEIAERKYKSQKRREQLEACARVFAVAHHLFPGSRHPLSEWQGWLFVHFHVAAWVFPTGPGCTGMQHAVARQDRVKSPSRLKREKRQASHGPRSPPGSGLEV